MPGRQYGGVDPSTIRDLDDVRRQITEINRYLKQTNHFFANGFQEREGSPKSWQEPVANPGPLTSVCVASFATPVAADVLPIYYAFEKTKLTSLAVFASGGVSIVLTVRLDTGETVWNDTLSSGSWVSPVISTWTLEPRSSLDILVGTVSGTVDRLSVVLELQNG